MTKSAWLRPVNRVLSQWMPDLTKTRKRTSPRRQKSGSSSVAVEVLEQRCLLAGDPAILGTATIAQGVNFWNPNSQPQLASTLFADVNADGKQDVISVNSNNQVVAYTYSTTGDPVQVLRTYSQTGVGADIRSTPAIANIQGVGLAIFAGTVDGRVFAWNATTGALLPGWPATVDLPNGTQANANLSNEIFGGIAVADLDGDSNPEILVTSVNNELTVFHSNGTVFWRFNNDAEIVGTPVVGDINRDGRLDVILAGNSKASASYNQGGRVTALSGDGRRMWVFETDQNVQSSAALGDLDADGYLDVVVGTGSTYPGVGNKVYALDHLGNLLPGWPYITNADASVNAQATTPVAIADLQGNGQLKVIVGDATGVYHAINANGTVFWTTSSVSSDAQVAAPIVADINGDNIADVVVAGGTSLFAFNGTDGSLIWTQDATANLYFRSPAIGHFKGDASWQLAVVGDSVSGGLNYPSTLQIYDLQATTVVPAWAMFRRDATGANALVRSDIQLTTFITDLYLNVLGRAASQAEIDGWLVSVRNSGSLNVFIDSILGSAEYRNKLITSWYSDFLGRTPDAGGLTFWQTFLANGNSVQSAIALFVASDEAFQAAGSDVNQWVTYVYETLLERTPLPAEVASWTSQLIAGTATRTDVANGFIFSIEYTQKVVVKFYADVLNTTPDSASLFAAAWDLRRGKIMQTVFRDIVNTNGDYLLVHQEGAFIRQLYRDVLNRDATVSEITDALVSISNGTSLQATATAVVQSEEHLGIVVAEFYGAFLGRVATPSEIGSWVSQLQGGTSVIDVIRGFVGSAEFLNQAGNTVPGFVNLAYQRILGRAATAADQAYWQAQAEVYGTLPNTLLHTEEFARVVLNRLYITLVRRLPNTQADGSAFFDVSGPFNAQAQVNFLVSGGDPSTVQVNLLTSAEYLQLALTGAVWTGVRWKNVEAAA